MRRTVSILALTAVLAACGGTSTEPTEKPAEVVAVSVDEAATAKLNAWFDEKYEEQLQFSPVLLTFLGRKDQNDKIDCFTWECQMEQLAWTKATVEEMEATFDYATLSQEAQISYDIWKYQYEQDAAEVPFRYNGYTFDQMNGAQSFIPTFLMNFHRVETPEDMTAYISRIGESARALREGIAHAKASAEKGVHAPVFAYEGVIDQSRKIITGAPFTDGEDSDLLGDIKTELATLVEGELLSQEAADAMLAEASAALTGDFKDAYEELIAFAEADMANSPNPEQSVGASIQPDGVAYYNYRLANQTTTNLTADEIHQIGLDEVARLRGEMEVIKAEVGFEGTLAEFFEMLRTSKDDERYYYPNTDEGREGYITDATAAIDKIKAQLPNYFGILPKADLVVKRVEPFREQDGAAQHYYPGTPDGSRSGTYYAHLSDMSAMPKRELEVIAYHEGLPGHHMQISIAQELEAIPQFRTQAGFTAYSEGWGLYSELLASEMPGTFEDPLSDFGRLGSEIWRAIRLVVDTGLHAKGWTEEEAVEYFLANAAAPEAQVRSEIQRYIVMPGQATSYKIGMIKILELRADAMAELGDKFDIKGFHDTVLGGGALPLEVLERRVDQWVASQKES